MDIAMMNPLACAAIKRRIVTKRHAADHRDAKTLSTKSVDNPVDFFTKKYRVLRKNAEKSGEIIN